MGDALEHMGADSDLLDNCASVRLRKDPNALLLEQLPDSLHPLHRHSDLHLLARRIPLGLH